MNLLDEVRYLLYVDDELRSMTTMLWCNSDIHTCVRF